MSEHEETSSVLSEVQEILTDPDNKNYEVNLSREYVVYGLLPWLQTIKQIDFVDWNRNSDVQVEEWFSFQIVDRFSKSAQMQENFIKVELSYRDINAIGGLMSELDMRGHEDIFLVLNSEFVKVGGRDNVEMREYFEDIKQK